MRAAIYTRVSTMMQNAEGHSMEAQHDRLIEHINSNGYELAKIYSDPGISAKDLKRPGIQELIRDLKAGAFDIVIVHKLDRLTRNISDLYDLVELVNDHNVKLISHSEQIDTSSPMGRMFVYLLGIFAQMFRENLSQEVTKGMTKRAEKGLHNVTVAMYGYKRDEEGNLHIIENEAKWVKWIFEQYIHGKGSSTLAKELNDMGIRRNQGAMWDQHKVMLALKNLHYTGKVHWKSAKLSEDNRIIREGIHEPIISTETYEKAQHILMRRKDGKISQNSYEYVFGGILKCGKCGGNYKGKYNKRKLLNGDPAMYRGYACSNNERYGNCDQSGISEKNMSKLLFKNIDLVGSLHSYAPDVEIDNTQKEIESMMKQSELKRARWQHAYGEGLMNYDDFAQRMKEEQSSMLEWESKLEKIQPEQIPSISPEQAVKSLKLIFKHWDKVDQIEKKKLIQSLFQRITILKEDTWQIKEILTI